MIDWAKQQSWSNNNIGAMGFCIGGHLAFRAALNPEIQSTACFYATDLHTNTIPSISQINIVWSVYQTFKVSY